MDRLTFIIILNIIGITIGAVFGIISIWQRHTQIQLKKKELNGGREG